MQPATKGSTSTGSSMIVASAWLLLAASLCLLVQAEGTRAASLSSLLRDSSSPASPDQSAAATKPAEDQQRQVARASQQQLVRRRRSSDQWPRHAGPRQQRAANEAASSQELSELIAQARQDKALERLLLKMLISATLRPSSAGAELAGEPSLGSAASIDQLLASAERAQREEQSQPLEVSNGNGNSYNYGYNNAYPAVRLIRNLEQILNNSPGFVDQSSSVNSNDLSQLAAAAATDGYGVDKREFKPCSFNAISCAKNPFRTS